MNQLMPNYRDPSEGFLLAPCQMLPNIPLWEPQSAGLRKLLDELRASLDGISMSDLLRLCGHPESDFESLCVYREYEALVIFMVPKAE
jgi:hypothetical protein